MVNFIYLLCAATALMCSVLLWRGYRQNRIRLLFWSSLCFLGLAAENVLLYLDLVTYQNIDLSMYRHLVGLAALTFLIYSMIWESK